jgi:hypothetical protein
LRQGGNHPEGSSSYPSDFITCLTRRQTDAFLTEEEARDLLGLEQVVKYRPATPDEANIIYCDIHSRIVKDGLERESS